MVSSKLNGFYQEKLSTPASGGCNQESLALDYVSPTAIIAAQNEPVELESRQQLPEVFSATYYDIVRIVELASQI